MSKLVRGFIVVVTAGLLFACGEVQGVSTAKSTNIQGAPGTAADTATGGQGNRMNPGGRS